MRKHQPGPDEYGEAWDPRPTLAERLPLWGGALLVLLLLLSTFPRPTPPWWPSRVHTEPAMAVRTPPRVTTE